MALVRFRDIAQYTTGRPIEGVEIEVRDIATRVDGVPGTGDLVPIYTDDAGADQVASVLSRADGLYSFWIQAGEYDVVGSFGGYSDTDRDVEMPDADAVAAGISDTDDVPEGLNNKYFTEQRFDSYVESRQLMKFTTSETQPVDPADGDHWYKASTQLTRQYYDGAWHIITYDFRLENADESHDIQLNGGYF